MFVQPELSEAEWALVVELLMKERDEMPRLWGGRRAMPGRGGIRADHHERLRMIEQVLDRIRAAAVN